MSPASSKAFTEKVSALPSTFTSSDSQVTFMPTGVAETCLISSAVPTVPLPSSSSDATLSKAVFSISAIIAGVANTSIVPLPIAFAVLSKVTVISFLPLIPACNILVSLYLYYKINPSIFTPQCPVKNKFINFSQFQKCPIHGVFCYFVSTHYF